MKNKLGQFRSLLKPHHFDNNNITEALLRRISVSEVAAPFKLKENLLQDDLAVGVMKIKLDTGELPLHWKLEDDLLTFKDLLYVPEGECRERILSQHHDSVSAGHKGPRPTLELITRNYWLAKDGKVY